MDNKDPHMLCDEPSRVYDLADCNDKTEITRSIVKKIASIGGHFSNSLRYKIPGWKQVMRKLIRKLRI